LKALKKGGKLIIGVPNSNPFLYKYDKYHTLNLPPHHMGLWNKFSLANLANYFPMSVDNIIVEALQQHEFEYYFKILFDNNMSTKNLFLWVPF
jgi:hypothetical protein